MSIILLSRISFIRSANDSLGEECKQCNTPCVEQLGVCTGLPDAETIEQYAAEQEAAQETKPAGLDPSGKCNAQDLEQWISDNGEETRAEKSNYCSREYNDGCFLDGACIEECFREVHGYSEECSECFGVIPTCSINSGCMMKW